MKKTLYAVLAVLGISLFCGVIVISIGFGSVFTQLNQVAGPIVCGDNVLEVVQHVDHYRPGETSWSISAYCVDSSTGAKKDVTGLVQFVAGVIYSLIPMIAIIGLFLTARNKKIPEESPSSPGMVIEQRFEDKDSDNLKKRLEKLKTLRESGLITDEDYQKKKDEILENL